MTVQEISFLKGIFKIAYFVKNVVQNRQGIKLLISTFQIHI